MNLDLFAHVENYEHKGSVKVAHLFKEFEVIAECFVFCNIKALNFILIL